MSAPLLHSFNVEDIDAINVFHSLNSLEFPFDEQFPSFRHGSPLQSSPTTPLPPPCSPMNITGFDREPSAKENKKSGPRAARKGWENLFLPGKIYALLEEGHPAVCWLSGESGFEDTFHIRDMSLLIGVLGAKAKPESIVEYLRKHNFHQRSTNVWTHRDRLFVRGLRSQAEEIRPRAPKGRGRQARAAVTQPEPQLSCYQQELLQQQQQQQGPVLGKHMRDDVSIYSNISYSALPVSKCQAVEACSPAPSIGAGYIKKEIIDEVEPKVAQPMATSQLVLDILAHAMVVKNEGVLVSAEASCSVDETTREQLKNLRSELIAQLMRVDALLDHKQL